MARVRVTPIRRKKPQGFAGIPGYVSTLRPSRTIRHRETLEERNARWNMEDQRRKAPAAWLESEGHAQMRVHWVRMNGNACMDPRKDWKKVVRDLRPKFTPRTEPFRMTLDYWRGIKARKLPLRGKGIGQSYIFLAHYFRAFREMGVPDYLMYLVAADFAGPGFSSWFFRFRAPPDHYISWDEFSWCIFAYVKAFET